MFYASADQRVLGYLGRALSLELSAVQLYSTQSRLVAAWGLVEPAERLKAEAQEEMGHVDRIIGRMLSLNAAPNASQLRPVRLGNSLLELLQHAVAFENEVISLYSDATAYCAYIGDHDGRLFFDVLLEEERSHGRELNRWIESLQASTVPVSAPYGATF